MNRGGQPDDNGSAVQLSKRSQKRRHRKRRGPGKHREASPRLTVAQTRLLQRAQDSAGRPVADQRRAWNRLLAACGDEVITRTFTHPLNREAYRNRKLKFKRLLKQMRSRGSAPA